MLEFLGKTNETDSTSWGNYWHAGPFDFTGEYLNQTGSTFTWESNLTSKTQNKVLYLKSGATDRNSLKNIYDVAGNFEEFTMETKSNNRILRGGQCGYNGYGELVNYRTEAPVAATRN